MNSACSVAW